MVAAAGISRSQSLGAVSPVLQMDPRRPAESPSVASPMGRAREAVAAQMGASLAAGMGWRPCAMETMHDRCAGIDIGKRSLTVCAITPGPRGERERIVAALVRLLRGVASEVAR